MNNGKKQYRIAVIPGDGIGKEVMPEGLRVIEQAAKTHGIAVHFDHFDFASYDYYEKHGQMMPDDWKAQIGKHDAIYFGARDTIVCSKKRNWLVRASLRLFTLMFRNSVRAVDLFKIPPEKFVEIGRQIEI